MVNSEHRVTIKRYANRRLYDTGTGTYVTVEDIAAMADDAADVVVYDAVTGEDITAFILAKHRFH
jgi:polyhydroxyalkanoate synthesis repressor PhaR